MIEDTAKGVVYIPMSWQFYDELRKAWSAPVQLRIQDDELVVRSWDYRAAIREKLSL